MSKTRKIILFVAGFLILSVLLHLARQVEGGGRFFLTTACFIGVYLLYSVLFGKKKE